ncbi:MAG: hypothetical protein ACPGVK_04160 [Halocynthiibacter sp.]
MKKLFSVKRFILDYSLVLFYLTVVNAALVIAIDVQLPMVVFLLVASYTAAISCGKRFTRAFVMPVTDMMVKTAAFWMTVVVVCLWVILAGIAYLMGADVLDEIRHATYLRNYWYFGAMILPFILVLHRASFRAGAAIEMARLT